MGFEPQTNDHELALNLPLCFDVRIKFDCLQHKHDKYLLPASEKKDITDMLIIYQLHSFAMGEHCVLNMFVL